MEVSQQIERCCQRKMTAADAAKLLADTVNLIESHGYNVYPNIRPVRICIRVPREGVKTVTHPDQTEILAEIWDEGDGKGWTVK